MNDPTRPDVPFPPLDEVARLRALAGYLRANGETYTRDALAEAARAAGYTDAEFAQAMANAHQGSGGPASVRPRATIIVLLAYGLTYAFFGAGFLSSGSFAHSAGPIALFILTPVLGIALLIAIVWVVRRGRGSAAAAVTLTSLLAFPIVMLLVVGGLCLATAGSYLFQSPVPV